jgi:hypothetical protein
VVSKKYRLVLGVIVFLIFGLTAYARSATMARVDQPLIPKPDQALIVFMRASNMGAAISSSLFDVSTDETKFIGVFKSGVKVAYDVAPGEHTFMVIGESADFMKATVSAGKTYYALVTPRMGWNKARFSLRPLRQSDLTSADFSKWDSATHLVDNTPETEEWAQKNASDIEAKRARWYSAWSALPPEKLESMTLYPEDGR